MAASFRDGGLYVRCKPDGRKTWVFIYRDPSKPDTKHPGRNLPTELGRIGSSRVAKEATTQHEKDYGRVGGPRGAVTVDANSDKGLHVLFTVDDPKVFTTTWSAAVTYLPTTTEWSEYICAENVQDYFSGTTVGVPFAEQPDF